MVSEMVKFGVLQILQILQILKISTIEVAWRWLHQRARAFLGGLSDDPTHAHPRDPIRGCPKVIINIYIIILNPYRTRAVGYFKNTYFKYSDFCL